MTDIVERLRKFVTGCDKPDCKRMVFTPLVCEEAANEIDRLRSALREIIKLDDEWVPKAQDDYTYTGYQVCADIARAALEGNHE